MRITWDAEQDRPYSAGVSQGVLYPRDLPGVPWNGLISVTENGEPASEAKYVDGQRYFNREVSLSFAGVISAYTYPDELEPYIGLSGAFTGQNRPSFGLSYRTAKEIHIVYNVLIPPSKPDYVTAGAEIAPLTLEWDFSTQPVKIPGGKPSAHIVILIDESPVVALEALEAMLYGDDENDPILPPIDDILALFESTAIVRIIDNGDGSWTATGPDDIVIDLGGGVYEINYSTVILIGADEFTVSTL